MLASLILAPALLLGGLEAVLRLAVPDRPRSLFVPAADGGLARNPLFYFQFFPAEVEARAYAGGPMEGSIAPRPAPGTCRIFVLGGSVALGDVPDPAFSFPRVLDVMLEEAFPGLRFEIQNLAMSAMNSHVMRLAARESAALNPDFFVVYMGNNEFIGPFGAAWAGDGPAPRADSVHAGLVWRQCLQRLRTAQWLSALRPDRSGAVDAATPAQFFENAHKVGWDAPGRVRMRENFADNLRAIARTAAEAGAETVLSTVAVNLRDWPPLVSFHRPGLTTEDAERWEAHREAAERQFREGSGDAGRLAAALDSAAAAAALDDGHAALHFLTGQIHLTLGDRVSALAAFRRARDLDGFRLTADSDINAAIREVAATSAGDGVALADTEARFIRESPSGVPGGTHFYDAMHVLFEGNHLIASSVFDVLAPKIARRFPQAAREDRAGDAAPLSRAECARRMGLSPLLEHEHLAAALEEVEPLRQFHPAWDLGPLERRIADSAAALGSDGRDEAIRRIDEALAIRGSDPVLHGLRARISK